jgi:hypothetical protein
MNPEPPYAPRNARWVRLPGLGQGYPALVFEWRGHPVTIAATHGSPRRLWFDMGLVFLGAEWERRVPPLERTVEGQSHTLRGFTDDPAVHALVGRYLRALETRTWREGPAG